MWRGIAAQALQSIESYGELLRNAGFVALLVEDLAAEWGVSLSSDLR